MSALGRLRGKLSCQLSVGCQNVVIESLNRSLLPSGNAGPLLKILHGTWRAVVASMYMLLLHLLMLLPVTSTCITNSGKTACGYSRTAAHGEVGCARTSAGICGSTEREIVCWDPPDWVRAHYGDKVPAPGCLVRNGTIACGYRCEGRNSEARCASSPDGICVSTPNGVACWNPPASSYCAEAIHLPWPECITNDGYAACGYGYGCAPTTANLPAPRPPVAAAKRFRGRLSTRIPRPHPCAAIGPADQMILRLGAKPTARLWHDCK